MNLFQRALILFLSIAVAGCAAKSPLLLKQSESLSVAQGTNRKGILQIRVRWPDYQVASILEHVNVLYVDVKKDGKTFAGKNLLRTDLSGTVNFLLEAADNLTVEVTAYDVSDPSNFNPALEKPLGRGTANVNLVPSKTTACTISLVSTDAALPTLTKVEGFAGGPGTKMLIFGSNLSTGDIEVGFNHHAGFVKGEHVAAGTVLREGQTFYPEHWLVSLPDDATTGKIIVKVGDKDSSLSSNFVFWVAASLTIDTSSLSVVPGSKIPLEVNPVWVFSNGETAEDYGSPPKDFCGDYLGPFGLNEDGFYARPEQSGTYDLVLAIGQPFPYGNRILSDGLIESNTLHFAVAPASATESVGVTLTPIASTLPKSGLVSTFAGDGFPGKTNERFDDPCGLTFDDQGNLFVADTFNHCVKKIDHQGLVSTLAGSGSPGFSGGPASLATFKLPNDLAFDDQGNLFVADTFNHCIRKIDKSGEVTTLAGNGQAGYAEGKGAAAQFDQPAGLCVDRSGCVFVADTFNRKIRRIAPDGKTSTCVFSGDLLTEVNDVAADEAGNLYVSGKDRVWIAKPDREYVGFTQLKYRLSVLASNLANPCGLVVDESGYCYVAETNRHRIRMILPGGSLKTLAGSREGYTSSETPNSGALFSSPRGIALSSDGDIFVADTGNHCVRRIR